MNDKVKAVYDKVTALFYREAKSLNASDYDDLVEEIASHFEMEYEAKKERDRNDD